ncbi:MAG: TspO/MBR family protein [bacterium]|nr:TspO/MBR family protein [bacterium]
MVKSRDILKLVIAITASEAAGIIGSVFTVQAIPGWYATLVKPAANPPSWLFGPVWVTLYLLMGIAAFLIWRKGLVERGVRLALGVFIANLFFNALWSIIFFGLRSPGAAFIDIVLLWLALASTIVLFYKISKPAAYLLIPYILWVSFAAYLNYSIWILN